MRFRTSNALWVFYHIERFNIMTPRKYKTSSGETKWEFELYIGRDPITKKRKRKHMRGFSSKNEALIAYSKALEEREKGEYSSKQYDKRDVTINDLYNEWIKEYAPTVEKSTLSTVEHHFKLHILKDLGNKKVQNLKPVKLQEQLNQWSNEAKSGAAWARYLKRLLNYAVLHEVISSNPFDVVKIPSFNKRAKSKPDNFLNSEQLGRFLNYWKTYGTIQQYAYFRLMSYTGLRRGEILALEWQDIDFQKKRLTVNKSIGYDSLDGSGNLYLKGTKTVASNRTISVDTTTLEIMTKYRMTLPNNSGNEPVWPKKFNKKTKWMAANIPEIWLLDMRKDEHADDDLKRVSLHGLRHTHATVLFEQAMLNNQQIPIKAVQKRLGHANVNVTMEIYTHMTDTENDVINSFLENGIE